MTGAGRFRWSRAGPARTLVRAEFAHGLPGSHRRRAMRIRDFLLVAVLAASRHVASVAAPTVGASDIGGVVTGPKGPEAGVWVIAETTELPTRLVKIVVTDDAGRYLIPELPKARYSVWVRGYG